MAGKALRLISILFAAAIIAGFLLLAGVFVWMLIEDYIPEPVYENNYRACVGIKHDRGIDYDWIVSAFGEPVSTEIEWEAELKSDPGLKQYIISTTHEHPEYGKLMFRYSDVAAEPLADTEDWIAFTVTTYNPEHYFGRHRIHVGSTREEVIRAYKKIFPAGDYPLGDKFYEGDPWAENTVRFTYDENDIVTSIMFIAHM